jgi:hypothetical protein
MTLDFPHRHAPGIQRQDLVVKAGPAGLVLGDDLGFKVAVAVTRDVDRQFAELAFEGLLATTVAGVARRVGDGRVALMTQVLGHFSFQCPLNQLLGELLEQPVLAYQVFRLLVVSQQLVDQFSAYGHYASLV